MGRQPQGHLEADPSAGVQQVLGGSQVQQQKVIFKGHGDKQQQPSRSQSSREDLKENVPTDPVMDIHEQAIPQEPGNNLP